MSKPIDPDHYSKKNIQPIDVIESWNLGFNLGNCIKYISRRGEKEGESTEDDLKKALNYLHREIYGTWISEK